MSAIECKYFWDGSPQSCIGFLDRGGEEGKQVRGRDQGGAGGQAEKGRGEEGAPAGLQGTG